VRYAGINLRDQEAAVRAIANERAKAIGELEKNVKTSNVQIPFHLWEQFIRDMQDQGEGKAYKNLEQKMAIYR
jgi:hypothetical protein